MKSLRKLGRSSVRRVVTAEARIQGAKLGVEACFSYYRMVLSVSLGKVTGKTGAVPLTCWHPGMTPL